MNEFRPPVIPPNPLEEIVATMRSQNELSAAHSKAVEDLYAQNMAMRAVLMALCRTHPNAAAALDVLMDSTDQVADAVPADRAAQYAPELQRFRDLLSLTARDQRTR